MHSIRRASLSDIDALQALYVDVVSCATWLPQTPRSALSFVKDTEGESVYVCCNQHAEIVGFISIYEPENFIHHLYVAQSHQGTGVGTALLKALEVWLPFPWRLKCLERNDRAMAFYQARGWVEESRAQCPDGPYSLLVKRAV